MIVQRRHVGKRRLRIGPVHLELPRGAHRIPFVGRHDCNQVLHLHHARAAYGADGSRIHRDRHRAGDRRPDHARMQHAETAHVGDVARLAEHLARHLDRRVGLADEFVLAGRLGLGLALDLEREAELLVPLQRDVEVPGAYQVGIAHRARRIGLHPYHAVAYGQRLRRDAKPPGCQLDQYAPCFGCGVAHDDTAMSDAHAVARAARVDGDRGVAHHQSHAVE
jgi:hypothetical protein